MRGLGSRCRGSEKWRDAEGEAPSGIVSPLRQMWASTCLPPTTCTISQSIATRGTLLCGSAGSHIDFCFAS